MYELKRCQLSFVKLNVYVSWVVFMLGILFVSRSELLHVFLNIWFGISKQELKICAAIFVLLLWKITAALCVARNHQPRFFRLNLANKKCNFWLGCGMEVCLWSFISKADCLWGVCSGG